jgi:hypothetical protein
MKWLGLFVRDQNSGVVGKVIGEVEWITGPRSLVVQPQVGADQRVPPTAYVAEPNAEVIPAPGEPQIIQ